MTYYRDMLIVLSLSSLVAALHYVLVVRKMFTQAMQTIKTVEQIPKASPTNVYADLELAHILFTDVVGYSKETLKEQLRLMDELKTVISASVANGKRIDLIKLPTGDGIALVFFGSPIEAVDTAIAISRKYRLALRLRMGIHSGPVTRIVDINERTNVSGGGINTAQRIMDCGDGGHILVSVVIAEFLKEIGTWETHLSDLGVHPVKHDVLLHLFSLHGTDYGNAAWPKKLANDTVA